jgi:hypothetical protein
MSGETTHVQTSFEDIFGRMLSSIAAPNKSAPEWQAEVSRLVGLAHVQSQRLDLENSEALRWMALVKLAEHSGSKEAKRRVLNIVRFKDGLGSEFSLPPEENLRDAYLSVLAEIKADWCLRFVSQEFSLGNNSSKSFASLVKWADRNASSPTSFFECTLQPLIAGSAEGGVRERGFKELQKHIKSKTFQGAQSATDFFCELTQCVTSILATHRSLSNERVSLVSLVNLGAERLSRVNPTGFINAGVLLCLIELTKKCPSEAKKPLEGLVKSYTAFTASIVDGLMVMSADGVREYFRGIMPLLEAAFPKFKSALATLSKRNPSLGQILTLDNEQATKSSEGNAEVFCALLIRWRQFSPESLEVAEDFRGLDEDIRRAAASVGVSYLGVPNEQIAFDPIAHRLLDESVGLQSRVRVLRPGVKLERSDGSTRVLFPALVEPITT